MSSRPTITASVVSGADREALIAFLGSLWSDARRSGLALTTVAIVNGPDEDLTERVDQLRSEHGWGRVEIVENTERRGFAANHNASVEMAESDFHLIANDDVIVLDGALEALVAAMESPEGSNVAVACPQLLNPDGTVQGCTYGFPSVLRALISAMDLRETPVVERAVRLMTRLFPSYARGRTRYWKHDQSAVVDSVRGAFVLVRRAAIDEVGLMDEISLVGGEELEWHRRMAERGWRVALFPSASVIHEGGKTVARESRLKVEYLKGLLNYFQKHGRGADVALLRAGAALAYGLRLLGSLVAGRSASRDVARAGLEVARRWPRIWQEARTAGIVHLAA